MPTSTRKYNFFRADVGIRPYEFSSTNWDLKIILNFKLSIVHEKISRRVTSGRDSF